MKNDRAGPLFDAARAGRPEALSPSRDFTYYAAPVERRLAERRRTRLRSGKLLDGGNSFLAECQIFDRSDFGARIRLFDALPAASSLRLYEDRPERLFETRIVWRTDYEIGLALVRSRAGCLIASLDLLALRESRYAVRS